MSQDAPEPIAPSTARTSVIAGIAQRIVLFGGLSAIAGIGIAQTGLLPPMVGFMVFVAGTLFGGLVAFVLGAVGLFNTRHGGDPLGRKNAITGLVGGLVLLAVVFGASATGVDAPPINDITTDLADPPDFATGPQAPDYGGRDMSYPPEFVEIVRASYPDLSTMETDLPPDAAFERALDTAEDLGWFVTWKDPAAGRFDAQERTMIFRFVDDVTVRVQQTDGGSEIDVRSKSRDGRGDLGANANRIRRFVAAF